MNEERLAKWVAALRSGEYTQARGTLRTEDDKFCCLGVLCNLVNPKSWLKVGGGYVYQNVEQIMPLSTATEGSVGVIGRLIDMNDIDKLSFDEIADWIETNL